MAFTQDGHLIWTSPEAKKLIASLPEFLDSKNRLSAPEILDWFSKLPSTPLSQTNPIHFGHQDNLFEIMLLGIRPSKEILLSIEKLSNSNPQKALIDAFNLTAREAEILIWLSRGKTNRDIGEILNISSRTVNKHLEQVFQKLGVDNRTAAAVMTDRICR